MNTNPQQEAADILRGSALATLARLDSSEPDVLTLARAAKQSAALAESAMVSPDGDSESERAA